MKFIPVISSFMLLLGALAAVAQNQEVTEGAVAGPSESVSASPNEPAEQPSVTTLFSKVNAIAEQLQADLADLETNIQASRDSLEKGGQVLDDMMASVTAVHDSMAEDSEIWQELNALLEQWEQRREAALKKSETNPEFLTIADEWKSKISTAQELRSQISTERANSVALMRSIASDRDMVLAYYELGQADKALESLQQVGARLVTLNENMQSIVETASTVETPISN